LALQESAVETPVMITAQLDGHMLKTTKKLKVARPRPSSLALRLRCPTASVGPLMNGTTRTHQVARGIDQRQMGEGLREIT
jgi:hypothetical protein